MAVQSKEGSMINRSGQELKTLVNPDITIMKKS
jgi:hypothetical protein